MSVVSANLEMSKGKLMKLTPAQTLRLNELMRLAQKGDYLAMAEFDELASLMKIRGYH